MRVIWPPFPVYHLDVFAAFLPVLVTGPVLARMGCAAAFGALQPATAAEWAAWMCSDRELECR